MLQLKEYLKHKYILTRRKLAKTLMHAQTHTYTYTSLYS